MPTAIIKGVSTIVWGTGAPLGQQFGAVAESVTVRPAETAPVEIADGQGFTVAIVVIDNGYDAEVTCLYDTTKEWPSAGDVVQFTRPGATGAVSCVVVAPPEYSFARKREGTITLRLAYRPGVTLS